MKKIGLLLCWFLQFSCISQVHEKINGVSFVASREEVTQKSVDAVKNIHANYVAIMPFGFVREPSHPEIVFNTDRQWFGETKEGARQYIELLHQNNIKVMLKPQIWLWRGEFTGTLKMLTEDEWVALEKSYDKFILTYVELAQETKTPLFCIGTELEQFVKNRPAYWNRLIAKIRKIYDGKLTYAANWDEYPRVPFWDQLDYIGIDAYFPLSEEMTPTLPQLSEGWQKHKTEMVQTAKANNKPILFTEYGYRSTDYTARKPWLVERDETPVNMMAQSNATKALFEEFWIETWFVGGFNWKWFIHHDQAGGPEDNRFTPQNKPVEEIIRAHYKVH